MRKIIEITYSVSDENGDTLFALCDDGTLWIRTGDFYLKEGDKYSKTHFDWNLIEGIPQDEKGEE